MYDDDRSAPARPVRAVAFSPENRLRTPSRTGHEARDHTFSSRERGKERPSYCLGGTTLKLKPSFRSRSTQSLHRGRIVGTPLFSSISVSAVSIPRPGR